MPPRHVSGTPGCGSGGWARFPQAGGFATNESAQQGSIVTGTRGLVGRSRMGIVVRKGAPLPDAIQNVTAYDAAVAEASASKDGRRRSPVF